MIRSSQDGVTGGVRMAKRSGGRSGWLKRQDGAANDGEDGAGLKLCKGAVREICDRMASERRDVARGLEGAENECRMKKGRSGKKR